MRIKTSAPGKLILFGEYAVLEGAPALVMAVNRFAEVSLQSTSSDYHIISAPAIGISDLEFTFSATGKIIFDSSISDETLGKLSFFTTAVEAMQSFSNTNFNPSFPFKIILDTSQFFNAGNRKLGLGSSAALTAALFSALCQFQENDFDMDKRRDEIFKTSFQIHRKAQNNIGSGIDIAASVFGEVLKYQIINRELKVPPVYEKLTISSDLHILFIWTGESASTSQFVQKVNEFKMNEPHLFNEIMDGMKQVSMTGIEAIQQNDVNQFLKAIRQYHIAMNDLGEESGVPIVSKVHQQIHDLVVSERGAYKPSGAGGGDIGIAFCNSATKKEFIFSKLTNNGFQIIDLKLAQKGVQVVTL